MHKADFGGILEEFEKQMDLLLHGHPLKSRKDLRR